MAVRPSVANLHAGRMAWAPEKHSAELADDFTQWGWWVTMGRQGRVDGASPPLAVASEVMRSPHFTGLSWWRRRVWRSSQVSRQFQISKHPSPRCLQLSRANAMLLLVDVDQRPGAVIRADRRSRRRVAGMLGDTGTHADSV